MYGIERFIDCLLCGCVCERGSGNVFMRSEKISFIYYYYAAKKMSISVVTFQFEMQTTLPFEGTGIEN